MRQCKECKKELEEIVKYCPHCGTLQATQGMIDDQQVGGGVQ